MLDQFSNLNSLDYALTGQNEQELMENLEMDVPKMDTTAHTNYPQSQTETGIHSSNVSPTVSPRSDNSYKQMPIPSQQNILVSSGLFKHLNRWTLHFYKKRPVLTTLTIHFVFKRHLNLTVHFFI